MPKFDFLKFTYFLVTQECFAGNDVFVERVIVLAQTEVFAKDTWRAFHLRAPDNMYTYISESDSFETPDNNIIQFKNAVELHKILCDSLIHKLKIPFINPYDYPGTEYMEYT